MGPPRAPAASARGVGPPRAVGRGLAWGVEPALSPCLDCGTDRVGRFCHACGQGEVRPDASVWALAGGAARDAVSWDERALRTLRVLLTAPGALSVAWADGRRARFVPPLRLFLVIGAALVALGVAYKAAVPDALVPPSSDDESWTEPDTRSAAYWLAVGVTRLGLNAVLLLVPLVGFATWVLYNARRPPLAAHLVHALHVGAVAVVGLIVWRAAALGWLLTGPDTTLGGALRATETTFGALEVLLLLWLGSVTAYAALSVRRFLGVGWGRAALTAPLSVAVPLAVLFGVLVAIYVVLLVL